MDGDSELRARLQRELKGVIWDATWKRMKKKELIAQYYDGDLEWQDLKDLAEEELDYQRELAQELDGRRPPPGRTSQDAPLDIELTDYEKKCQIALSEYLAKQVSLLPPVRRFRDEVLEGGTLSLEDPKEVKEFLDDELYLYIHDPRGGGMGIDPAFYPEYLPDLEELKELVGGVEETLDGLEHRSSVYPSVSRNMDDDTFFWGTIAYEYDYPHQRGVMELIYDKEGRSLGDLARRLASMYPWKPQDAAWFVLTGWPPTVLLPLTLYKGHKQGIFTLTFTPWISRETFRQVYRTVQSGDNQPLTYKTLRVLLFVTQHTDSEGRRPSWDELLGLWNQRYPAQRFTNRSGLYRAYKRAERELAAPWLEVPENLTAK